MKRVDRYIARAVLVGSVLALAALLAVNFVVDLAHFARKAAHYDMAMDVALLRAVLVVPRRIYEFFPTALLLGGLVGLGGLAARNELLVLRGFGWSIYRLAASVLWVGVPVSLMVLALGEYGVPAAERALKAAGGGAVSVGRAGDLWIREGRRFINVARVLPGRTLEGVWVYDFGEGLLLREVVWIHRARYDESRGVWHLRSVIRNRILDGRIEQERFRTQEWEHLVQPTTLDLVAEEPERMPARRLAEYVNYLRANGLDPGRYEVALWSRLVNPFTVLPLLAMAVPFSFGPLRKAGAGQRLMAGMVVGVVFHLVREAFSNMAVIYDWAPWVGTLLPFGVLTGIAVWMLRRAN